jgi:phage-related minor tail protein
VGTDSPGVIDQLKDAGGNLADQASTTVGAVADRARDQATSQLEGRRDQFAGSLSSTAKALRQTGQQLRNDSQETVAQAVETAAERVDRFARYLNERRVGDVIADVERFGRNEPGLFLTAAFGVGLFAARFLKSASPRSAAGGNQQNGGRSPYYRAPVYGGYVPGSGPQIQATAERERGGPGSYAGATTGTASRPNGYTGQTGWNEGMASQ